MMGPHLTTDPIRMDTLEARVAAPGAGAIVTFAGTTRNETHGRAVAGLSYEAYEEMAEAKLAEIEQEAAERFAVKAIALLHRLGEVGIGETSIGIAVSSAHRPAAFDAARFAIEAVKKDVPIWKRERFTDGGEEWVHPGKC